MRKILNEQQIVDNILSTGLYIETYDKCDYLATNNYNPTKHYAGGCAELGLLIKHFSSKGLKPKEIKDEIKKLWVNYNPYSSDDIKMLDNMIKNVRKSKDYDLIEVTQVEIPTSALEWFKSLIGTVPEPKNEAWSGETMTVEHVKVMFTLWVWAKIQEQYKEHGIATIYMDNSKTRLKREANVRPSVKMMDIIGLLYQAGYIDVPMGKLRRYIIKFWDDVPMDYDNMVTIQDFENIGRWFEDYFQLKPTRHVKTPCNDPCPVCGKTFEHKSHNHNELCPKCKQKRDRERDKLKKRKQRASNDV